VPSLTKPQRLAIFFDRLAALPPAATFTEARAQIERTLREVEDEFSGIPDADPLAEKKGRMFPAQDDKMFPAQGLSGVVVLRSRFHNTYISSNGAIEIRRESTLPGARIDFEKVGLDGRKVSDS
jgi:hypothetical protein